MNNDILNDARYKSVAAYMDAKAKLGTTATPQVNSYDEKADKVYANIQESNTKELEAQLAKLNQVEEPAVQQAATKGLQATTKTNDNYLLDDIKREHATGGEILGDTAIAFGEGLTGAWSTIGKTSVSLGIPLRRIKEYITDEDALTVQQALDEMDNKLGVTTLNSWFQSKKSEVNQNKLAEISRIENDPTMNEVQKGLATTQYYANNPDMAGYGIITSLVRSIAEIKGVGKVMGNLGTVGQKATLGMGVSGQAGYLTNAQQNGTATDATLGYSLAAGAGTAALGVAAHKIIGGTDLERIALNGATSGQKGIANWLRGGVQEFTEEVPQGAMGTAFDNYENDRPIKTGMGKTLADSAVMGFGSGLVGGAPSLIANGAQASVNKANTKLSERDVRKNGTAQENVDPANEKFNPTRAYKSALYDLNSSDPVAREEASKLLATATSVSYEQLADFDAQIAETTNETTKKDLIAQRTKFENEKLAPLKAEVNTYINQSVQNKDNFMAIMTNYALEKSQREQEAASKPSTIDGYDAQALKELTEIRDAQGDIIPTGLTIGQNIGEGIAVQTSSNAGQFQGLISAKSKQYGVPATLINAIVQTESEFNPNAKSGAGAVGLMQLMPGTAKDLKVADRANPEQNIDGGVRYIGQLLKRYNGDMNNALMAYNWGMGNVDAYLKTGKGAKGQAIPKETTDYLRKIKGAVNAFSNGGQTNTNTNTATGKPLEGKLKDTDPRISELVMQAAKNLGIKIGVSEGRRTVEAQKENVANGKSQTMNSKHLHGGAVDFHIIGADGKANWDFEAYRPLAEEAKRLAKEKGYEGFEWGGDWNTLKDGVHFQFKEGSENLNSTGNQNTEEQAERQEADASINVAPIPVSDIDTETEVAPSDTVENTSETLTDTNTPIGDGQINQTNEQANEKEVADIRTERKELADAAEINASSPETRTQEIAEASQKFAPTKQYGKDNTLQLHGLNGQGNPIYVDNDGKRYTEKDDLIVEQPVTTSSTSPKFEDEAFRTKSEYESAVASEFVNAPIPVAKAQETKASSPLSEEDAAYEEQAMRQTRAFFSSMSEEEIDTHPLLAPEQKIALKQLSAFKRQLANTQTTDTVRMQIIKGYEGKDNRDSHLGLEQYDTILNQAIASNDKGTAATYLGYLKRFADNSVAKSGAIEQALVDGATNANPVFIGADTKGAWQQITAEQYAEAGSNNSSVYKVSQANKGTKSIKEEAEFLTEALNTFTASTKALLGNDVVPITPSQASVVTSQTNSNKSSSEEVKQPVPPESEQSDSDKTGFKALTRVENYSEVPADAEYLGRATVEGKITSMGNIKSVDDIGNPGWLGNPHNDATPAKSMEKYIGSLKENAAKYPEFVQALIETKGKALYGNTKASKRSEVGLLTEMLPQLPDNYRDALDYINRIESYNPDTGIKLLDKAPTPPKAEEPAAPVRTRYDVDAVKERSAIPDPKGKSKAKSKGKAAKPVSTTNARTEISVNTAQETDTYVNSYSGNNGQGVASTVSIKRDKKTNKLIEVTYAIEGGKQAKTFTLKDKTVSDELLMSRLEKKLGAEEEFVQINLNNQDEETTQEYEGRVIPNELVDKTVNLEEAMKLYADDIEAETVEPQERALYKALIDTLLNFNPEMKVLISKGTQENGFDEDTNTIKINLPMTEGNILQEIARIVVSSTTSKVAGELELLGSTDMVVDLNKLYDLNQDLSKLKGHIDTIIRVDDSRYTKFSDDVKIKILNAMKSNASLFEMATTDMDIMKFLQGIEVPKTKVKQSIFAKIVSSLKSFLNIGSNNQINNQFDKLLELTVRAASEQSRNLSVDFKASDDAKVHTFRGMDNNSLEIAQQVELKKNFYERNQLLAVFKQSAVKGKPLTRIANLTDKLKLDLMQGLQSLVSEAPTKAQREQIEDFLVFRDEMAEHILQTFRKKMPAYLKDKEGNPILDDEGNLTYSPTDFGFQDLKTYFMDNNGDIDNNVVTSVALAAYDWVVENGNKTQNMDKDIKKLLNLDPDDIAFLSPAVRELYQFRGGLRPYATAKIGKKAVEVLGIKATENASAEAQSRLENSIGEWAISAMQSADLVHITSISSEQHKANIEEVGGDLTNFSTVDNGLGQVSFLSITNPEGLDVNPRLYEVFMKNKGTVGYMGEVFGTEIGLRAPLKSAPTKTIDKIKRTISTMSLDQRKYVEKMQAEPISINVDMSNGLQNLLASDRDTTLEMIGASVTDETLASKHKLERHSLESAAEGVFRDLENGLDFINSLPKLASNKLQEFYDYVYAAKNNRMHYASNMFNFQSSKIQRSLGEYSNFENTLDISVVADNNIEVLDENNQVTGAAYFIRAVAESAEGTENIIKAKLEGKNFVDGFTVDKIDSINFIDPFYQYLRSDIDVQTAVKATTKLLGGNKLTSAEVKSIAKVVKFWEGEANSLRALIEYTKFQNAVDNGDTEFTTSLGLGSDGINNGSAISYMQMGVGNDKFFTQVGMLPEDGVFGGMSNYFQTRTNSEIGDYYTGFEPHIKEAFGELTDKQAAILELNTNFFKRKSFKAVLIPFGYSAGMPRLKALVYGQFMSDIMGQLVKVGNMDATTQEAKDARQALENKLNRVLTTPVTLPEGKALLEFWFEFKQENELKKAYESEIGKGVVEALEAYAAPFMAARDRNVKMQNAAYDTYNTLKNIIKEEADKTYKEYLAKQDRYKDLTDAQLTKLVKVEGIPKAYYDKHIKHRYDAIRPTVKTPFNKDSTDWFDDSDFSIPQQVNTLKADPTSQSNTWKVNAKQEYVGSTVSVPKSVTEEESSGVMVNSAQVQGTDAKISARASAFGGNVNINVHDANISGLLNYVKMGLEQNKATYESLRDYHAQSYSLLALSETIGHALNMYKDGTLSEEVLTDVLFNAINDIYGNDAIVEFQEANKIAEELSDADMLDKMVKPFIAQLLEDTKATENAKLDNLSRIGVMHQYGGEGAEYVVTAADKAEIEVQRKEIDKLYKDIAENMGDVLNTAKSENIDEPSDSNTTVSNIEAKELNPKTITNHSGGAYGADAAWDVVGREFGVVNHKHYRDGANTRLSARLKKAGVKAAILTKEMMDTARVEVSKLLGITYKDDIRGNLQVRNYYQVSNADSVLAIAELDPKTQNRGVKGGTNTAVQLAIKMNKPVYVWDTSSEQWYVFTKDGFVVSDTPVLTENFAGVGTRDIESYNVPNKATGKFEPRPQYMGADKQAKAEQAIRVVYAKSVKSKDTGTPPLAAEGQDSSSNSQVVLKPISEAMASIENMLTDPSNNITEQKANLFNYVKARIKAHEKESGRVIRTAVTDKLNKGERGRFDVATSTIFMSKDYLKNGNPDQQLELLLHEMMHALTAVTIATSKDADVRKAVGTLETMRKQLQAKAKKEGNKYYANVVFASVDEFVAYGMTDAAVMQYMNDTFNSEVSNTPTIKFSSRVKSGALKFLKSVFTLFGGKSTEYENFLRSVDVITASYSDAQLSDYNGAVSMYSTAPSGTDALRQLSSLNVSTEHNNHLNDVINTTITQFLEANTAKTDLIDKVLNKVSTKAINAGFKMSDKELHVNEIVKEIAKTFLTENSGTKSASDVRAAYTRASKEVTVDMFLNDPSTATPAERKQAQKQYNYLFKANNPEPVERFFALTISSEEVQKVMAKLDNTKTVKEETTWFGKLMEFFTNMMRWLSGRALNTNGLNMPKELDVLFERLGNINKSAKSNHVNMFDKGYAFTTKLVTVPANFVVSKLMDAIFGVFNFGAASSNPTIRAASSAIVGMRETGIGAVADSYLGLQTRATTNDASGRLNGLGEIIYEMGRNKGMKQVVESLIRMTTKANQSRQLAASKAKDALIKVFTNIDNVPKSQLDAVTQVALRTDASALMRHGTSITQVIGLLKDTGKRKKMIAKLEAQIATHPYSNDVLLQTKALGHYMATEVAPEHLVKNAEGIAIGKGSWYETDIANMDTALRDTIDQLASLYAMEATSKEAQSQLNTLIAEQPEAVKALLNHHLEMVNRSMEDFKDNMPNYSKGYMPQKTNDLRSLKFAEDDLEITKLEAQGWEKVSDGDIRQDVSDNTDGRTLMFHNDMLYRDYVSGALDMKDTHAKGTMVYNVAVDLAEVNRVNAEKIASRRRRSQTNHKQFNFSKQAEGNLIASYNAEGELTGYHYEMSGRLRDTYLERDNNAIELLGRYHSNLTFKPEVAKVQRTIAQELYQDFKDSYGNDPRQFVTLDPESKDPNVVMMWRMMPYEFRAEASKLFGKGMPIVVRSTVYNTVFGFRTYSMSEMFDKVTDEKNVLEVFLTGVLQAIFGDKAQMRTLQGERLWQKGISQIKDFIVIRNYKVLVGNIVSNALLLSLQGVSPTQQIKDFISVWNNGGKYRDLAARVVEIDNEIAINRNRPKEISRLKRERNLAMIEMERNPLHDFMEEGLMSSIVEDTDLYAEDSGYKSELDKKIDEYAGNIPKQVVTAFNWALMSPGTPMHNFMAHSTQFSDLAAKYSLTKHRMSKGDDKADAIAEAQDAFINYDIPTGKGLDYLNKMGLFMFTKFVLRFQQAIMKQLSTRAGSAISQHLFIEELTNQAGVLEPFLLNRLGNPLSAGMLNYGSAFNNISTVSFMKGITD